ncbi:MAG: 50S ribosomal protein L4, partial [Candidatus Kapaibacteriota bacterium]
MLVDVYSKEGKVVGQIELRDDVFAVEPHEHAMHMAVVAFLANQRQGTHKTKVRSEVRG